MDDDHDSDQAIDIRRFRMSEARDALGISQKTLIVWLVRGGYDLELVVERADPNDLRQRYLASEIIDDLAKRHVRTQLVARWRQNRDLEVENEQLRRRVAELARENQLLQVRLDVRTRPAPAPRVAAPVHITEELQPAPVQAPVVARAPVVTRPLPERHAEIAGTPPPPRIQHQRQPTTLTVYASRSDRYAADQRVDLKDCDPIPPGWLAMNTTVEKHGMDARTIERQWEKYGLGGRIVEKPDNEPPWVKGQQRVRMAYSPQAHIDVCLFILDRWPHKFKPSCGPECPYPAYAASYASSSGSLSLSESSEKV